MVALTLLLLLARAPGAPAAELKSEYEVKAALLVTFLKYVEREVAATPSAEIVIGIVGDDPFGDAFAPAMGKPVMGRRLKVTSIESAGVDAQALAGCDLVFVASSARASADRVLALAEPTGVLTVGEIPGFLEKGGVINFVLESAVGGTEVGYEINQQAASARGLRIHTALLKSATRVIRKS